MSEEKLKSEDELTDGQKPLPPDELEEVVGGTGHAEPFASPRP
jgi:hypothetical protein